MTTICRILRIIDAKLYAAQRAALIGLSIFVVAAMTSDIFSRYFLQTSIWGMEEINGNTAVWLYLIGAAFATQQRTHIKADMAHLFLKNPRALSWIRALASAVSTGVATYMLVWSFQYVTWSLATDQRLPSLRWPAVYFQAAFLVAAVLMTAYFLVEFVDNVRQAVRRDSMPAGR